MHSCDGQAKTPEPHADCVLFGSCTYCSSYLTFSLKDSELVKSQNLLQPRAHANAAFTCSYHHDRIVCVGILTHTTHMGNLINGVDHDLADAQRVEHEGGSEVALRKGLEL